MFSSFPPDSRLWAFGTTRPLSAAEQERLLGAVDAFLAQWNAHGQPLTCGRDWREGRFLAIAVDQRDANASGCSIDGLYRVLREVERELDVGLLGGGLVYFRDDTGAVMPATREEFAAAAERGAISRDTIVFDLTVDSVGDWREELEKPARQSWHDRLIPAAHRA
jgi:hypothetical protein